MRSLVSVLLITITSALAVTQLLRYIKANTSQVENKIQTSIVYPSEHGAYGWRGSKVESEDALFEKSCPSEQQQAKRILRSSLSNLFPSDATISASDNGLVDAILEAYNNHLHLILRPEDIWFAILTQFNFYVNANAESLREQFVAHQGRKEVKVKRGGSFFDADIGALAVSLTEEMNKYLVDPSMKEWIMPNFTTTTKTDHATAAILMMGSMQKYFKYKMSFTCGIPSVTLLGNKEDWINIRQRLDKLAEFGKESAEFSQLLIPILDQFVQSFEDPKSKQVNDFWNRVCFKKHRGSGSDILGGWLTAFCFWNEKGRQIGYKPRGKTGSTEEETNSPDLEEPLSSAKAERFDISIYKEMDVDAIPNGFAAVPVQVDDNGKIYWTRMVAGSIGMQRTSSGEAVEQFPEKVWSNEEQKMVRKCGEQPKEPGLDTIQPLLGWWMYEVDDSEAAKADYSHED